MESLTWTISDYHTSLPTLKTGSIHEHHSGATRGNSNKLYHEKMHEVTRNSSKVSVFLTLEMFSSNFVKHVQDNFIQSLKISEVAKEIHSELLEPQKKDNIRQYDHAILRPSFL